MTWSIIFRDRPSGHIVIAVATKFFSVGAHVPSIEPQKGAVCTQTLTNLLYGPHGLRLIRGSRRPLRRAYRRRMRALVRPLDRR